MSGSPANQPAQNAPAQYIPKDLEDKLKGNEEKKKSNSVSQSNPSWVKKLFFHFSYLMFLPFIWSWKVIKAGYSVIKNKVLKKPAPKNVKVKIVEKDDDNKQALTAANDFNNDDLKNEGQTLNSPHKTIDEPDSLSNQQDQRKVDFIFNTVDSKDTDKWNQTRAAANETAEKANAESGLYTGAGLDKKEGGRTL